MKKYRIAIVTKSNSAYIRNSDFCVYCYSIKEFIKSLADEIKLCRECNRRITKIYLEKRG